MGARNIRPMQTGAGNDWPPPPLLLPFPATDVNCIEYFRLETCHAEGRFDSSVKRCQVAFPRAWRVPSRLPGTALPDRQFVAIAGRREMSRCKRG